MKSINLPNCAVRLLGAVLAASMDVGVAPAQAVYVPNFTTSSVSGYLINPATGALDPVAGSPFTTGQSPVQAAIHPAGKFLYTLDAGSGDITLFAISAPSGSLRPVPCLHCDALSPSGMAIDPTGQYLFVTSSSTGTVTPYSINVVTGQLTKGSAASTGVGSKPVQAAVDPSGRYLYVANSGTGQVAGFSIQGASLTPLSGSPYAAGSGPSGVAASRTAVYVSNLYSADISVHRISAGGVLVPAGASVPAGGGVTSIAVDPSGNFIYAPNQNQILAYNTTPNGPFPLTFVQALNGGTTPSFVATAPDGNFVYVANTTSNDINGFAISAGGTLIPAGAASTFGAAGQRFLTVGHIGDTTAIVLTTGYPAPPSPAYGTPVQLKGAVRNTRNPGIVPQGSVTVSVNGVPVPDGTVPLDETGAFSMSFDGTTQFLPAGTAIIRIAYNPGVGFEAPAPFPIAQTITKAAPAFTITTSPAPAVAGQPMTIAVSAPLVGAQFPSGTLTISVDGTAVGAAPLVNGSAQLSHAPGTGNHSISGSYGGDGFFLPASVGPANFHASQPTATAVTATPTSVVYGQTVTLTASVAAGGSVSGTVDFFDNGLKINPLPVPISAGRAQFGPYALTSVAAHAITAKYSGDQNSLRSDNSATPLIVTVNQAQASVTPPVASGNLVYGQPSTFTVTVAPVSPGSGNPSGAVTFKDGNSVLGTATVAAGLASFTTSNLAAGSHTITADYGGDTNFHSTSSPAVVSSVGRASPAMVVSAQPQSPLVFGQQVSLKAALSGNGTISGTVDFTAGGVAIGSATVSGGIATLLYRSVSLGTIAFTAAYQGDANNLPASGTLSSVVNQAAVAVSLSVSAADTAVGQPLAFSASVAAAPPGAGIPTGIVDFQEGGVTLGSANLTSGTATFTTSQLPPGQRSIVANYRGDANFVAGGSAPLSIRVAKSPTTATLLMNSGVATFGHTISLLATVVPAGTGSGVPTGAIRLSGGDGADRTAILSSGQAAFTVTLAATGSQPLRVSYEGDVNFAPSTSAALAMIVDREATDTMLTVLQSQTATTLTARVSSTIPFVPTGTVRFVNGGSALATTNLDSGGVATAVLPPGTSGTIAAVYSGDANFYASTSSSMTVTATPRSATGLTLGINPSPAVAAQSITCTVTLNASGPATPSGRIGLFDGAILLGSVPAANQAVFTVTLAAGNHNLTASYSGDLSFEPASATSALTVSRISSALVLTTGSTAPMAGDTLTLTAILEAPSINAALEPGGRVDFFDGNIVIGSAAPTNRAATLVLSPLEPGPHQFRCVYSGDANWNAATSNTIALSANKAPTIVEIRALPAASDDQQTTVAAIVKTVPPGLGTPSGTLHFYDIGAGKVISTVQLAGATATASVPEILKPAGIVALYDGDTRFQGGSSALVDQFSVANAASYAKGPVAPGSIVTVFGSALSDSRLNADLPLPISLGGVSVTLVDSQSVSRNAALFSVTPAQVSFLVPAEMPPGPASLTVAAANGTAMTAVIHIGRVSPGLFTANANGRGVAAAQTVRVRPGEPPEPPQNVATYDEVAGAWIGKPIELAPGLETYLILYGTGFGNGSGVLVELGGQLVPVLYAGPHPVYPGLDQINVLIPPDFKLDGLATITVSAGGERSNAVELVFRTALTEASADARKF